MPEATEPMAELKDSMVESVQREMRRRKRMLSLFLLLACVPVVVAIGVLSFGSPPQNAAIPSGFEAELREVGQLAEKSNAKVEETTRKAELALLQAENAKERIAVVSRKAESVDDLRTKVQGLLSSQEETLATVRLEATRSREALMSARELMGQKTAALEESLTSRIEGLAIRPRGAAGEGTITRFHPDHQVFPAHFSVKAAGKVSPGDIGIVTRRGLYCGMVRVIARGRGTAQVVAMPETVGPQKIRRGDQVQFRAVVAE